MQFRMRVVVVALAVGVVASPPDAAAADADACLEFFADRPLRWIVPAPPGGGYDTYSRLVAPHYARALGTRVVVENISGGDGLVALEALRTSSPDRPSVGLINGPALLVGSIVAGLPDPSEVVTLLGRVTDSRHNWVTGPKSGIESIDDVFEIAKKRPLVFGVYEPFGTVFMRAVTVSSILGVPIEPVPGFAGSRQLGMSAIRGDVDLIHASLESSADWIRSGELRPLLQISNEPSSDPLLEGVPVLGGADGLAARRAAERGGDPAEAVADVEGVLAIGRSGRVVGAPADLDPQRIHCMRDALQRTLADPAFRSDAAAAGRPIRPATGEETLAAMETAKQRIPKFLPAVKRAGARLQE